MKQGIRALFTSPEHIYDNEHRTLKNSKVLDAIELLNEEESVLNNYDYLIDLTFSPEFKNKHKNLCTVEDVIPLLKKTLPCYVDGEAHWLINKKITGSYYLTVFNHKGIKKSVEDGETVIPNSEITLSVSFKNNETPTLLEGDGIFNYVNGKYFLTIPAGGWAFIKF